MHGEGKEMQTLSRNLSILPSFFFFKANHLILRGQNEMLNDGLGKACFSNSLFTSLSLSLQRHWFTEL